MKLKIGRYEIEDITNKDWILDNGACYQMWTRTYICDETRYRIAKNVHIRVAKALFNRLVKQGLVVRYEELEKTEAWKKRFGCSGGIKAWRFNVEQAEE